MRQKLPEINLFAAVVHDGKVLKTTFLRIFEKTFEIKVAQTHNLLLQNKETYELRTEIKNEFKQMQLVLLAIGIYGGYVDGS